MSEQTPTIFKGRYEVHRKLARGGMSDVYLAHDRVLDRPIALKVLFPEYAKDETFVARFRREAQAAAKLNHPNIVGVYDWGEESGTYFIAMEYIEGRTLGEIVRAEGRLHPRRAAEAAADVASALGFAHRNGVIHRDVKPGNVMCESSGLIKVADFGIAQAIGGPEQTQLTRAGSVMGTATYFSPEQAQGRQVDPRSDIYSLGCVLFEILTGRPPFAGETPVAIAYKHVQEPPPRPSTLAQVPAPLEAIVLKCLAKNPDGRYATAEDLRADLRRFLEGHPVAAMAAAGAAAGLAAGAATAAYAGMPTGAAPAYGDATVAMPASGAGYPGTAATGAAGPYGSPPGEKKKPNPWLIGALIVFLLLVAGGIIALIMNLSANTSTTRVPDVIGKPYSVADAEIRKAGLVPVRENVPNETVQEGNVFEQSPRAEREVQKGSQVTLQVSAGRSGIDVQNVVGSMVDQAEPQLRALGFNVSKVEQQHDTEPAGKVLDQDPKTGKLPRGSMITLTVSSGKGALTVRDVRGLPASEAEAALRAEGFQSFRHEPEASDVTKGNAIRTNPPHGAKADRTQMIIIYVSTGQSQTTREVTTTTRETTTTRTTRPTQTTRQE